MDGVNNAPNTNTTSPCNSTAWHPQSDLLTATDGVNATFDLPHEMSYAKTIFACPTPAAPNRNCSSMCGSVACTDSDPLKVSDFLTAAYNYRSNSCTQPDADNTFKQVAGHYQGWPAALPSSRDVLWNYWTYAQAFLLQDKMFSPVPSYSRIAHEFLVSAWAADDCANGAPCPAPDPNHAGNPDYPTDYQDTNTSSFGWKEITSALNTHGVSWRFYRGDDWNPALCPVGSQTCTQRCTCMGDLNPTNNYGNCFVAGANPTSDLWNPLPFFTDVQKVMGSWHGDSLQGFLSAVNTKVDGQWSDVSMPQVSWIIPGVNTSEHPNFSYSANGTTTQNDDPRPGQAYVTTLLQQIMKNTAIWNSSVVFLAWDDWGGYYDHVRPPRETINGVTKVMYGPRVPAMVLSPWLGVGKLDHQTLSFDAYLKFIEDLWLYDPNGCGAQRVGDTATPACVHGTADNRPTPLRENQPVLGDLLNEFDFYKVVKAPPLGLANLSCNWPPGP